MTANATTSQPPAVALVGMAVLLPGAPDLATYWRNLVGGVDAITDVPEGRWDAEYYDPDAASGPPVPDRFYCRRGGFVDELAEVQPTRFGLMPSSVAGTEPDQLIALQVASAAIADAGGPDRLPDRDRVGVVLGRGGYATSGLVRLDQRVRNAHQVVRTLGELLPELTLRQLDRVRRAFIDRLGPDRPESAIGMVPNLAASRLANRLDLRGPAFTVDAACASSLVAVDHAVGELMTGRCDAVLAGGVHHCHDVTLWSVFTQLRALSPSQRIRPFHRGADGILIGEGTGVVVLKRLADAERDDDRIYAVIRGTGVAGDGRAAGLASPDPGGQSRAVRAAWRMAGLDPTAPGALGLLEAHGTATPAGDAAELATLAEVFGPATARGERAVLGSVKSMIGHAMPAAGVAALVKAALAVHHGVLLPTLHCDDPHPALGRTRFRTVGAAEPWETGGGWEPRRAGVNAFGFGGINAHVVLEQASGGGPSPVLPAATAPVGSGRAAAVVAEPERVLRLSADGPDQLAALLGADDSAVLAAGLPDQGGPAPRCRVAVVDPTAKRLELARRAVSRGRALRGRGGVWFAPRPLLNAASAGPGRGRVAFLFPGLEGEFAPRVDDVATHFGLPRPGPVDDPSGSAAPVGDVGRHGAAVVVVGRLLDAALRRIGVAPDAVAGHSVGEWTAMGVGGLYRGVAVDSFLESFDPDALRVPGLAFAALGAGAERVLDALAVVDGMSDVVLSHDNAPQQSIVCGPEEPVADLVGWFRARGVLGRLLPFRSGFHTPMLAPYLAPIRQVADRFEVHEPSVPVWSATTAAPFPSDEAEVRTLFLRHLLETVRFRPLVEALYAAGFRAFVQMGAGQLGSLVGDTLQDREHLVVAANSPHRDGLPQLRRVAAAMWAEGAEPDHAALLPARGGASAAAPVPPGRSHPAVPLDLGGALISLDTTVLATLRAELAARPRTAHAPGTAAPEPQASPAAAADGRTRDLSALSDRFPPVAELDALLRDTERAVIELITASARTGVGAARPDPPAPPSDSTPSPPVRPPSRRADDASTTHTTRLHISTEAMPYLLDHCFFRQRPGWPDLADRWPVVPATTIVRHLMDAAERAVPARVAVGVCDLRFGQWVPAATPVDVEITLRAARCDRLAAAFGDSAHGTVELADRYPAPPTPWPVDQEVEHPPELTAARLYAERWLFHGPAFQGLTELTAVGDAHVRGVIRAPAAPGALLDNIGQLLGYWIAATRTERTIVFPVGMRQLRFFGPSPRPGTELHCHIRVTELTDTVLGADAQLRCGDAVWAEVLGWQDRRFDSYADTRPVERRIELNTLSTPRPGGWVLLYERWRDLASRDLVMRRHLGSAERARYERLPPRGRRAWLLGRIAVKDAVRRWLWEQGEGPVFPAEIEVLNDPTGRPRVSGAHGRTLPGLDVSLAHRGGAAVAIVWPARSGGPGIGIDVEEVAERPTQTLRVAFGPAERELLAARQAADGGTDELWFTRFWAAKEAVAKAEGTGLRGRPRQFAVVAAAPSTLLVTVAGPGGPRTHRVRCAEVGGPPGGPGRDYVVAWTTDESENPEGTAAK
ncbi:type I polyketide synthase [Streptantibioticus ferralitis]|uniref:Beta-ketoacyl synthase N-terminal-like domain-containing protein n=1 Tax=Streptantibioticus ferralitis TaxID=236510 RepID=A0ABT5YUC3_9ACTN|nr:type I polyketide synthase [Streptantibioticus ferralitis]MDF2255201.1 beta-ketoacyl synthase N-terminal-like domain-containing protein [Streptantibioticus ferralitis]